MRARYVFEHAANIKDKYYANPYVLVKLYTAVKENIPMEDVTEIVEPAAGDGAIIPYIEKLAKEYDIPTKYYDLDPDIPEIEQMNFYKTDLQYKTGRLTMTGPPYSGKNWILFAKKAAEIGDWVAFISPHSFLDYKHPIPDLELIYQEDLGLQDFSGSKVFGGKDHPVKTAILLYKRIDPYTDEVEDLIDQDFSFRQFKRGDDPKGYDYFVSRQGYNAGEVSDSPDDFFSSIGIKVNNEDMREDLETFLDGLKAKYDHLFLRYSPTTKKTINLPRIKQFIRRDLYNFMNEAMDFKRGRDPREVMEVGMDEYLRSLDWPTTRYSLEKEYLDDPNLEILNYKGFTLLLKPEEDYRGKIAIHNPWNSNDIWTGMCNSRKELGEIGAHTRGPGRKEVLDNLKRSINYRLRKTSESYNFERGKDPKKTMDIGRVRSYPGMDPEEFADWFDEEIGEYLTTRDEAQAILDNMIGNDWETDEEVRGYLLGRNVEKELVDDMIKMRDYFNDKKYINKIRLAKWLQILPENWGQ